jgi:ABC-2 type transport system ATP-binding protein
MEILKELQRMGKTIFISSHILSELALLCDSVTILDRGTVRYSGSMSGLNQGDGESADFLLTLAMDHPGAEQALRQVPGVIEVVKAEKTPQYRVRFHRKQTDINVLLRTVLDRGAPILGFQESLRQLNQAFMDLTSPGVPPPIETTEQAPPPSPGVWPPGDPY